MSHAHLVRLEEDLLHHPQVDVQELHLGHVVVPSRRCVEGRRVCVGRSQRVSGAQHAPLVGRAPDVADPDVAVFDPLAPSEQEALPLDTWQACRRPGDELPNGKGDQLVGGQRTGFPVDVVAGEHLVSALSREHHFHILGGQLRQEEECVRAWIRERLVEVVLDIARTPKVLVGGHDLDPVFDADGFRQQPGVQCLVVPRVFETDRVRSHGPAGPDLGGDIARVDPARQEAPNLDVGDLVGDDRFRDRLSNPVHEILERLPTLELEAGREVAADLQLSIAEAK